MYFYFQTMHLGKTPTHVRKPSVRKPSAHVRKPSTYVRKPSAHVRKSRAYVRKPTAFVRKHYRHEYETVSDEGKTSKECIRGGIYGEVIYFVIPRDFILCFSLFGFHDIHYTTFPTFINEHYFVFSCFPSTASHFSPSLTFISYYIFVCSCIQPEF